MEMKKILFATDYSEASRHALEFATSLACDTGAALLIAHVTGLEQYPVGEHFNEEPQLDPAEMRDLKAVVPADPQVQYEHRLVYGEPGSTEIVRPASAIVKLAKEEQVDAIVLATHGRSGFSRLLMGSVAEYVVRNGPCPVVTVKQPESNKQTRLTALEFLAEPERALTEAVRVARCGLLLGVLNRHSLLAARRVASGKAPWQAAHFFTVGELVRLVKRNGDPRFQSLSWKTTLWPVPRVGSSPLPWGGFIGMSVHLGATQSLPGSFENHEPVSGTWLADKLCRSLPIELAVTNLLRVTDKDVDSLAHERLRPQPWWHTNSSRISFQK